jgi:O-antigen/teichoic acid export membrane protein
MRSLSKTEFIWGYAASTLNIGAGIMLLPIILRFLPPQDVGLWFVFITLAGFAQLIEFGFQPTLARNTAYIYAGAQNLSKFGLSNYLPEKENINLELLNALFFSAKKIYRTVSIASIIILWVFGTLYISTLIKSEQNKTEYIIAWLAFSSGSIVNFYYGYVNGILQGRGDVGLANKVTVLSKGSLILLGAAAVASGFGLVGFGFAAFFSACISRIAALHYFSSGHLSSGNRIYGDTPRVQSEDILEILWYNAGRLGLVQIGAFLIQRGNILIASSFLGLSTAASYGMSITVLTALLSISAVICQCP